MHWNWERISFPSIVAIHKNRSNTVWIKTYQWRIPSNKRWHLLKFNEPKHRAKRDSTASIPGNSVTARTSPWRKRRWGFSRPRFETFLGLIPSIVRIANTTPASTPSKALPRSSLWQKPLSTHFTAKEDPRIIFRMDLRLSILDNKLQGYLKEVGQISSPCMPSKKDMSLRLLVEMLVLHPNPSKSSNSKPKLSKITSRNARR